MIFDVGTKEMEIVWTSAVLCRIVDHRRRIEIYTTLLFLQRVSGGHLFKCQRV